MSLPIRAERPGTLSEAHEQLDAFWSMIETLYASQEQLKEEVAELRRQVEELTEKQGSSSQNSSNPPSTDNPEQRAKRPRRKPSGRGQGGQPGHLKHERSLVPEETVDQIENYYPDSVCSCGGTVAIDRANPYRHQVFDIPPMHMQVNEYRFHTGECGGCGKTHHSDWPAWVPSGQMGPGLIAWIAVLSGQFHLSMRKIQQLLLMMCQDTFSLGAISKAQGKTVAWIEPIHEQVGNHIRQQAVAQADETRHYHGVSIYWMWILTSGPWCYFMTHYSRGKKVANFLLRGFRGYLVTDHFGAYNDYPREWRQLCWAHLTRHFRKVAGRCGDAGDLGQRLLLLAHALFRTHHRFGHCAEERWRYQRRMSRLRKSFRALLEKGLTLDTCPRTQRQCKNWQRDELMCWTFLKDERIPLTNNWAEAVNRPYVIWRKICYASQSLQGDRFRPMILTVVETAKRMEINPIEFMRSVCAQGLAGKTITIRFPFNGLQRPEA